MKHYIIVVVCLIFLPVCSRVKGAITTDSLKQDFKDKYGQIEIGGPQVGLEFHHSRPLPNRISFYVPVANSIDLSQDYWKRDQSQPLRMELDWQGKSYPLHQLSCPYRYTPYQADFFPQLPIPELTIGYRFSQDIPAFEYRMELTNTDSRSHQVSLRLWISAALRTCQTYAMRYPRAWRIPNPASQAWAEYPYPDTDSAGLFILNRSPEWTTSIRTYSHPSDTGFYLELTQTVNPQQKISLSLLVGSAHTRKIPSILASADSLWTISSLHYQTAIEDEINRSASFVCPDTGLVRSLAWSKSLLASLRHQLNQAVVPMPCPAEYNFFFTHDLLMTDWGAVIYDSTRVKNDLLYLITLTRADSILPHAAYWKDGTYQTEFCQSDNWNHLWFLLVTSAYLKHSGDQGLVLRLYPILAKSLQMMLSNKNESDLMCAWRPDWWDIGHVYGARVYLTSLMIRVLREWVSLNLQLGFSDRALGAYLQTADRMEQQMMQTFWDDQRHFLMSQLDSLQTDSHYYTGSLMPIVFNQLDPKKCSLMLVTAHQQLLDPKLGTRIVMPADFHLLTQLYNLKDQEAGDPYTYINGGIWTQGIAWHALAYLTINRPDSCLRLLKDYFSLDGIRHSPQGLPSFFEYRMCNPDSPLYGQIDKPTFLWSGGWYIHTLYHLAGLRVNEWNLSFDPLLPQGWSYTDYEMLWQGQMRQIRYQGEGSYFRQIIQDGHPTHSAIIFQTGREIVLERGIPAEPYLASATCRIKHVTWLQVPPTLRIKIEGIPDQFFKLELISPFPLQTSLINSQILDSPPQISQSDNLYQIEIESRLDRDSSWLEFIFRN